MAGDLSIQERLLVKGAPGTPRKAIDGQETGRVLHRYGDRVRIVEPLPGAREEEEGPLDPGTRARLSPVEALGLAAFQLRSSPAYAQAKSQRPRQGQPWNFPPGGCARTPQADQVRALRALAGPTSAYLEGSVAVGVVIVGGPGGLQFSAAEQAKVVAEVQNGLSYYAGTYPAAGLSFTYDIQLVQLNVAPDPNAPDLEGLWRNPAMVSLGYPGSGEGVTQYIEHLRQQFQTRWTYCAFFTKYPVSWFAYAFVGGPYLVMHYDNDGWGPDNIDRVFAHESGHIFMCPDEYASSGCSCGGSHGRWGKPNSNCENCAPGGGVPCIMKGNDWSMCTVTPAHLGWMAARLVASHSRKTLDVANASTQNGAHLIQYRYHGGENQLFRPDPLPGGYFRFVCQHSGKVLDVEGASLANSAPLIQYDWHGGDNQQFRIEPLKDGNVRIIAKHSGKVLDVAYGSTSDSALVIQYDWHGSSNQRWLMTAPIVAKHSGKVLDVEGASSSSGAHIVQFAYHGRADELFRPEPLGDGCYRFVSQLSGKVLDVEGASMANSAPLIQYDWHGGNNQRFRIEPLGDGNVRIVARHSGKVLDVAYGSSNDSAPVIQYDWHGGNNQRWLVPHW
ncbi:MAG TPA: RICIN domain-containing protein [Archangium sp.]|uniref:RICIN domain-containing protein n=1 Tax=Archangium sp. TaxID=1872627 RepID=UPI002E35C493|nr:RICIN domain-containing protein [Archangium sp.]HEX5746850.1 RICIN domain-containing protein [Archangium sp.]